MMIAVFARLMELVNGDEALVRRGRLLTTTFLLQADDETWLVRVLEGCRRQLDALDGLIQSMTPAEKTSKLKRTWHGLRSYGKDTKIRETVGVLTEYKAIITLHLSAWQVRQASMLGNSTSAVALLLPTL